MFESLSPTTDMPELANITAASQLLWLILAAWSAARVSDDLLLAVVPELHLELRPRTAGGPGPSDA